MGRAWSLVLALAGVLACAALASLPGSVAAPAQPDRFSGQRALADIRAIAVAPHVVGSPEDARVRAYLSGRLSGLGLTVGGQTEPVGRRGLEYYRRWGGADPAPRAVNVVGVLPGRDPAAPAVVLMAHHDTVPGSPGAADDSAGVAVILETVRALKAGPQPLRNLVVAFTDAEEVDSSGAKALFERQPLARRAGAVINLETRGGGGRALMFETGAGDGPMMALFARAVRRPFAQSAAVLLYRVLPNSTDFTVPARRGLLGFNFAFIGRPALYHAPQSTPDAIDAGSVQHMGDQVLDLARALVAAPALPPKGGDAVFSDLFGLVLVVYPPWVGWVSLAATVGLLAFAAWRVRLTGGEAGRGLAKALGFTVLAAALLHLANMASGSADSAFAYYDRLAAIPLLELQAVLISLAVFAAAAVRPDRSGRPWGPWFGALLPVLALVFLIQWRAPGAAPVFAWPLGLGALAAALAAAFDPDVRRPGMLAAIAGLGILGGAYVLSLAHVAFLGVGADMPAAMAPFALVVLALVRPLMEAAFPPRRALAVACLLVALGFGAALWVRFDPPAPTIPTYAGR